MEQDFPIVIRSIIETFSVDELKELQKAINEKLVEKPINLKTVYEHMSHKVVFGDNVDDCKAFLEVLFAVSKYSFTSVLFKEIANMLNEKSKVSVTNLDKAYAFDFTQKVFREVNPKNMRYPTAIALFKDLDDTNIALKVLAEFYDSQK